MILIGFGHKKRVGKDTACKFAIARFREKQIDAQRCSFFDPVKKLAFKLYSWGGLQEGFYYEQYPLKKEEILPPIGRSPRQIYDELGSTIHKLCERTLPEIALTQAQGDILVIPDVRRPIEIEYIHKLHGKVYRIDREGVDKSTHLVDTMLDGFDGWDGIIENNGSLRDFYQNISKVVDNYG